MSLLCSSNDYYEISLNVFCVFLFGDLYIVQLFPLGITI
jgi:hypothetical protein